MTAKTRFQSDYNLYTNCASLKIKDVRPEDIGIYTCLAENPLGTVETSAVTFVVNTPNIDETAYIDPEKFINLNSKNANMLISYQEVNDAKMYIAPYIIKPLQNVRISEGNSIILKCLIDGYPKPKVIIFSK